MVRGFLLVGAVLGFGCGGEYSHRVPDDEGPMSGGSSSIPTAGTGTTARAGSTGSVGPSSGGTASKPQANYGEGQACYNDSDCPNPACGGLVCNWMKLASNPEGNKVFYCNPAGTQPAGLDGWCTTDADCKCRGVGAVCRAPYCTFTAPP